MKNARRIFIFLLCLCGLLFPAASSLLAASSEMEEMKKMEKAHTTRVNTNITRKRIDYKADGLRDPFKGRKDASGLGGTTIASEPPALTVQGIVWGGVIPQAIINNKVLKIGDTIQEAHIIDINRDGVTVLFGGQQYTLYSPSATDLKNLEKKLKSSKESAKESAQGNTKESTKGGGNEN